MSDKTFIGINKKDIQKLPLYRYQGEIEVINDGDRLKEACQELVAEEILGFDTESRPSFKKGDNFLPSLVQFATASRVYLIQIDPIEDLGPLIGVLEDRESRKVGVALHDDIARLGECFDYNPNGFEEIVNHTSRLGIENRGLRGLAAYLLGVRISKSAQVSNWAQKELTRNQISYAATDAWVSREIYLEVKKRIAESA